MDATEEPTCRQCQGDRKTCGPMVRGREYGPEYIGLKHLPRLGERRHGGRVF
jgi:hypothetical protein